jgi:hypothetical protein
MAWYVVVGTWVIAVVAEILGKMEISKKRQRNQYNIRAFGGRWVERGVRTVRGAEIVYKTQLSNVIK